MQDGPPYGGGSGNGEQIGGLLAKIASNGAFANQMLAQIAAAIASALPFSGTIGTFTLGAAVTTTVLNANVKANSFVAYVPLEATAGTLMGSAKSLYISNRSAGVSFAVSTANGVAAAGTEQFVYIITNIGTP